MSAPASYRNLSRGCTCVYHTHDMVGASRSVVTGWWRAYSDAGGGTRTSVAGEARGDRRTDYRGPATMRYQYMATWKKTNWGSFYRHCVAVENTAQMASRTSGNCDRPRHASRVTRVRHTCTSPARVDQESHLAKFVYRSIQVTSSSDPRNSDKSEQNKISL